MIRPTAPEWIERCWHGGMGIRATCAAVRRVCGQTVTFEQVHAAFVALSAQYAPIFLHQPERTAA